MLENKYLCGSDAIFEGVDLVSVGRVVFIEDVVVTTIVVDVDVFVVIVVEGGMVVVVGANKIIQSFSNE